MIVDNVSKRVVTSLRSAQGRGFGRPKASAPRQRGAARRFGLVSVTLCAAALAIAGPAHATPLPLPFGYVLSFVPPAGGESHSTSSLSGTITAYQGSNDLFANATASLVPNPLVQVDGRGIGYYGEDRPQASAILQYDLRVNAPPNAPSFILVPIDVEGSIVYSGDRGGAFAVEGYFEIGSPNLPVSFADSFDSICTDHFLSSTHTECLSNGVSDDITIISQLVFLKPGVDSVVTQHASFGYFGFSGDDVTQASQVSIVIDPIFSIDPDFLAQNPGYSLELSDGVGNVPDSTPVPEPATWAMTLAGVGGLATARGVSRHSRRLRRLH